MKNLTPFSLLSVFLVIFVSFFFNYLSSSYAEIDLFKLNLLKKEKSKKVKKIVFILKNERILFLVVCFSQVILNTLISIILTDNLSFKFIKEKTGINKAPLLLGIAFLIALFTELLSHFLATRKKNHRFITNSFFVNFTYLLLRPFYFLRFIIKPKKKIFSNSEQDLIRFFDNLMTEKVIEKSEARLVQSALLFDETTINHLIIPFKRVISLKENMSLEEVKKIHFQSSFTRYPVLDQKNEKVVGVISMKRLFLTLIKEKDIQWQNQIDRKVLHLAPSTKLNKAFEKSKNWNCKMIMVKTQKKSTNNLLGIITLHDILNALIGKIQHKPEKTFPLLPAKPTQPL
ncbi:MAG: hymolysin-related protein [Mycoplasmataceae bacterium RC_NB112A]|nr:MAG: hymolysin-related protein [Mycoplasmataceae bacterium RC_NB112A]